MSGRLEPLISQEAYIKIILHALKHPSQPVNGVLLGGLRQPEPGNVETLGGDGVGVEILDAVPLFHSQQVGLAPMLEVALAQVDEYFSTRSPPLSIVGCYYAAELYEDPDLAPVAQSLGDKIAQNFPHPCVLVVDNTSLSDVKESPGMAHKAVLQVHTCGRGGSWIKGPEGVTLKDPAAGNVLKAYVEEGRQRRVVDFDDHLDDVAKDWLNPSFFK